MRKPKVLLCIAGVKGTEIEQRLSPGTCTVRNFESFNGLIAELCTGPNNTPDETVMQIILETFNRRQCEVRTAKLHEIGYAQKIKFTCMSTGVFAADGYNMAILSDKEPETIADEIEID